MRTSRAEQSAEPGDDTARDERHRDNPRRRREPRSDCDDNPQLIDGTTRPPLRHGVEHDRGDRRRLVHV